MATSNIQWTSNSKSSPIHESIQIPYDYEQFVSSGYKIFKTEGDLLQLKAL